MVRSAVTVLSVQTEACGCAVLLLSGGPACGEGLAHEESEPIHEQTWLPKPEPGAGTAQHQRWPLGVPESVCLTVLAQHVDKSYRGVVFHFAQCQPQCLPVRRGSIRSRLDFCLHQKYPLAPANGLPVCQLSHEDLCRPPPIDYKHIF